MQTTHQCKKLFSKQRETNIQAAENCMLLIEKGCKVNKAVKYNTRRNCKFDNTKILYGPPDFRILKLVKDKNISLGWQQEQPIFCLKGSQRYLQNQEAIKLSNVDINQEKQSDGYQFLKSKELFQKQNQIIWDINNLKGQQLIDKIKDIRDKYETVQQLYYIDQGKYKLFDLAQRKVEYQQANQQKGKLITKKKLFDLYQNESIYEQLDIKDNIQETNNKKISMDHIDTQEPTYLKSLVQSYQKKNQSLKFLDKIIIVEKLEYQNDEKKKKEQVNIIYSIILILKKMQRKYSLPPILSSVESNDAKNFKFIFNEAIDVDEKDFTKKVETKPQIIKKIAKIKSSQKIPQYNYQDFVQNNLRIDINEINSDNLEKSLKMRHEFYDKTFSKISKANTNRNIIQKKQDLMTTFFTSECSQDKTQETKIYKSNTKHISNRKILIQDKF